MVVSTGLFDNFKEPAIMFFFLGWLASLIKSDLAIPSQILKFLGIYLLMAIGIKGGRIKFDWYKSNFYGSDAYMRVDVFCHSIFGLSNFAF